MKSRVAKTLIIIVGLFSTAQTNPKPDIGSVQVGNESVPVRIEYEILQALTGSHFDLDVIFTGPNVAQLKIDAFDVEDADPDVVSPPVTISVEESIATPVKETPTLIRKVSHCRVKVADHAEPQAYRMKMTLSYPGKAVGPKYFDLFIGAVTASEGRLTATKLQRLPLICKTGVKKQFNLPLQNEFDSYTATVKEISLSSDPPGLVAPQLLVVDIPIAKSQSGDVPIEVVVSSPDLIDLIKGFSEDPNLIVKVTYQDNFGRSVPDLKQSIPMKIIPNTLILLIAIVVGVLVGTFVRFYLEFLARKRKLRRSEVLRFVLYTTVFGLIVAAIALAGQFEIKALDHTMGSYDRPLVMFVIGLAAAMGGLQIIVAWYNSLRPKEEKPDA